MAATRTSTTYTIPDVYLFTVPARVHVLEVDLWAAGGGGGVDAGGDGGEGGGGGGAYVRTRFPVTPGDELFITVGAGGAAGAVGGYSDAAIAGSLKAYASPGNPGSARTGGTGGSLLASVGEIRNAGGNGGTSTGATAGGAGGGGGGGNLFPGSNGSANTGATGGAGGLGGAPIVALPKPGGAGGAGGNNTVVGSAGVVPGGGGGGGGAGANAGAGANGKAIVSYFVAAAATARIAYDNAVLDTDNTLTTSSQESGLPKRYLQDPLLSKVWRSRQGYNVVTGFNDQFKFTNTALRTATLDPGNYLTPALYAAEVTRALNAASAVADTYLASYSSSTHKFTVVRATGANPFNISLDPDDVGNTCLYDLGMPASEFVDGANFNSGGEIPEVSYHSREFLLLEGPSSIGASFAAIRYHNLTTTGQAMLCGSTTAAGTLSGPSRKQELFGNADLRSWFQESSGWAAWRLIINDVTNPDGYSEVGVWFLGTYAQPGVAYDHSFDEDDEPLSALASARGGAHHVDTQPDRRAWQITFSDLTETDRDIVWTPLRALPPGVCFFFAWDAELQPSDVTYGFVTGARKLVPVPGNYWTIAFPFAEALP